MRAESPPAAVDPSQTAPGDAAVERWAKLDGKTTPTAQKRRVPGAARKPGAGQRRETEDGADAAPRANKLVPTNAVHTTKRRLKRGLGQNRILTILAIAALAGLVILSSQQPEPPALTPLERQAADAPSRAIDAAGEMVFPLTIAIPVETALHGKKASAHSESPVETTVLDRPETGSRIESPLEVAAPNVEGPSAETGAPVGAAPDAWPETQAPAATAELNPEELAEMERMLARLELEPSKPDGVVDRRTKSAIRLYQQIAGLPVDGEPTQALLADMRAVVRIFEAGN